MYILFVELSVKESPASKTVVESSLSDLFSIVVLVLSALVLVSTILVKVSTELLLLL